MVNAYMVELLVLDTHGKCLYDYDPGFGHIVNALVIFLWVTRWLLMQWL